jgi:glycine cleavage system H lipoate-binding protein
MFDLLSIYPAKLAEYLLAITYLALFVVYWKYVTGGKGAALRMAAHAPAPRREAEAPTARRPAPRPSIPAPVPVGWFQVPAGVHLHPGHAWARLERDGLVTVGADDFAHKLVGPAFMSPPPLGGRVAQGEAAFAIGDAEKSVPMLSPVDGEVVAVNSSAREHRNGLEDPYGAGWLYRVRPSRLGANLHQLLEGAPARHFLEGAGETLAMRLSPELGRVLQDGGVPVHGIARAIAGEGWDEVARRFFMT